MGSLVEEPVFSPTGIKVITAALFSSVFSHSFASPSNITIPRDLETIWLHPMEDSSSRTNYTRQLPTMKATSSCGRQSGRSL
jgi:hypothetical protein